MQKYVDNIFGLTGLCWVSGYFLPDILNVDDIRIYIAQLAIRKNVYDHEVIVSANLDDWLEKDPIV